MLAPADAPRSEKRAFGRPSVKRRAGLSSSSVVGLIAVSIRAIFCGGAAPRAGGEPRAHGRLWLPLEPFSPNNLRAAGRGSPRPLRGVQDVTDAQSTQSATVV